jgi:hypothetical protein
MANELVENSMELDSLIPTGPWTLYFHSPEETKWTLTTFSSVCTFKTWRDFWNLLDVLKTESLSEGAFFIMRDPLPPLWEHHQNIRGGCYSFRCQKKDAADVYINYIIASMLQKLAHKDNVVNGLSISLKRGFNVIKVWNMNAQAFHSVSDLDNTISSVKDSDIIYTPFVEKKM